MPSETETFTKNEKNVLEYSFSLGILAMEGRGFEYPTDIAIASNGRLYVPNRARDAGQRGVRITVLDEASEYYGTFGLIGNDEGQLIAPMAITEDKLKRILVTDEYSNQVSAFDHDGNFIMRWGEYGDGNGQFNTPSGIVTDHDNNVYITDTRNHRIQKFTEDGHFILSIGNKGSGAGEMDLPWGLTISPSGELYVADWGNDRILRFSLEGNYIENYGSSGIGDGEFRRPSGVAVDNRGYIYVSDWGNERVQVLDEKGVFLQKLRGESSLSKWAAHFLDTNSEEGDARKLANLEPDTSFLDAHDPHAESAHIEKFFWAPLSVELDGEGRLFVVDSNRHRIQIYNQIS